LNTRILLALGAVVVAVVLFLVLRPEDGDDDAATTPTAGATTTNETTTSDTETVTGPTITLSQPEIVIRVRNGAPVRGVARVSVERGERVRLVVRSDVADHVHVHGYDLFEDVAPGMPARFSFPASTVGGFEVELEERHLLLAVLRVQP
jgi:hypothetical protein